MRIGDPAAHWLKPPGPVADGLRIGLLGGSFNPAHEGHLHVSDVALKRLRLDYVWWMVSPQNPLKPSIGMAPLDNRVLHARKWAHHKRIRVMDIEAALGTRYTIDTLRALRRRFPQVHFVWLMGSDNLEAFRHWRRWAEIAQLVPIAVVTRPGSTLATLRATAAQRFGPLRRESAEAIVTARPPALAILDGRRSAASSTAIREREAGAEALVRALPA